MPNTPHVHRRTAENGKGIHDKNPGSTIVIILIIFLAIMIAQSFCR